MLIGWFLYSAAQASYQQSTLQETLSGMKVKDIMVRAIQTIDPSISIDKAVDEYFLKYGYGGFPVIDDGKFLGIITLKEVKNVPREDWGKVKVSGVFVPHDKKWEVSMNDDVITANIVAVGIIERQKIGHITFGQWIKPGTIVSIPTLAIATLLIYLQFY